MEWEIVYDNNGKAIGKKRKQKDSLLRSIFASPDRLLRGMQQQIGNSLGNNDTYMSGTELENYKNPLNIAKDIAGTASFVVPGGGMKNVITAGALGGFGSTYGNDKDTLKGTLTGGALGGGLGLAGKGLSKLAGKIGTKGATATGPITANKLTQATKPATKTVINREAEELGERLSKALNSVDESYNLKGIQKANQGFKDLSGARIGSSQNAKYGTDVVTSRRQAQSVLRELGLPENLDGIKQAKSKLGDAMDGYITQLEKQYPTRAFSPEKIFDDNFTRQLDNLVDLNKQITPETLRSKAVSFLNQGKYGEMQDFLTRKLKTGDLTQAVRDINQGLRTGKLSGADKKLAELIKDRINEQLGTVAPQYNNLSRSYAVLSSVDNPTALIQERGMQQTASINPATELLGKLANFTKPVVGKAGEFATNPQMPKSLSSLLNKTKTAVSTGKTNQYLERLSKTLNDPRLTAILAQGMQKGAQMPSYMAEETQGQYPDPVAMGGGDVVGGYTQDQVNQILGQYLQAGYSLNDIEKMQKLGIIPSVSGVGAMTADTKNQLRSTEISLQKIQELKDAFNQKGSSIPYVGGIQTVNPLDAEGGGFGTLIGTINQEIMKSLEGGRMTDADVKRYKPYMPQATDTKERAIEKINNLEKLLLTQRETILSGGTTQ